MRKTQNLKGQVNRRTPQKTTKASIPFRTKGFSGLSRYYSRGAKKVEDHTLKTSFNPRFKYMNFIFKHEMCAYITMLEAKKKKNQREGSSQ